MCLLKSPTLQGPPAVVRHEKNLCPLELIFGPMENNQYRTSKNMSTWDMTGSSGLFLRVRVFLWDHPQFQNAWVLFLSPSFVAGWLTPFPDMNTTKAATRHIWLGSLAVGSPVHQFVLSALKPWWMKAIKLISIHSRITLGAPNRILKHRLLF